MGLKVGFKIKNLEFEAQLAGQSRGQPGNRRILANEERLVPRWAGTRCVQAAPILPTYLPTYQPSNQGGR
jgi:hypothetical protein